MQLEDRYYTSTEVAEILGVSLRSVYRYLEDNKLIADIKTATGRHRFTKQNILNFLYPDGRQQLIEENSQGNNISQNTHNTSTSFSTTPQPTVTSQPVTQVPTQQTSVDTTTQQEEQVDWLSKFRQAAEKYKETHEQETVQSHPVQSHVEQAPSAPVEPAQPVQATEPVQHQIPQQQQQQQQQQAQQYAQPIQSMTPQTPPEPAQPSVMYYRSMLGGLKDIAQNLDKSARNSNLDYAFTLNAGASLHKPIKPFATLHAYVKPGDRDFFEKILRLTPANESNAQLCLILDDNSSIYSSREEVHGLYVVSKSQLRKDINTFSMSDLAQEISDILV